MPGLHFLAFPKYRIEAEVKGQQLVLSQQEAPAFALELEHGPATPSGDEERGENGRSRTGERSLSQRRSSIPVGFNSLLIRAKFSSSQSHLQQRMITRDLFPTV